MGTNFGGVHVGCHCWGAIAGWVPLLGCHCWMLATNLGGVPLLGAIAGCHCWAGCHCAVSWLDAIIAGC